MWSVALFVGAAAWEIGEEMKQREPIDLCEEQK